MNGEFRALSLGSLAAILIALGAWAAFFGPDDDDEVGDSSDTALDMSNPLLDADGPVVVRGIAETGGMDAGFGGTLTLDGECLHFGDDLAIVWPVGTTWDRDAEEVVLRDGLRIRIGAEVWGGGGAGGVPERISAAARALLEGCIADFSDEAEQVVWLNDRPDGLRVD